MISAQEPEQGVHSNAAPTTHRHTSAGRAGRRHTTGTDTQGKPHEGTHRAHPPHSWARCCWGRQGLFGEELRRDFREEN